MAWSLEEKLLVVGTQDGIVAVWDMEEHQVVHVLTGHTGEAQEMAKDRLPPGQSPDPLHYQFTSASKAWLRSCIC